MPLERPKKERGGTGIKWDIKILLERGSDNDGENCIRTSCPIHTVHQIL